MTVAASSTPTPAQVECDPRRADAPPRFWLELATALVITLAGLFAAWAGFQASLWEGVQAGEYARANDLRNVSSRQELEADALQRSELSLFMAWADARASGEFELARFYRDRFPPNTQKAFDEWITTKPMQNRAAPKSPLVMPSYRPPGRAEAVQTRQQADQAFAAGQEANNSSDRFGQANLVLTTALTLAGIAQVFRTQRVRMGLVVGAGVLLVIGAARIATLPTIFLFLQDWGF